MGSVRLRKHLLILKVTLSIKGCIHPLFSFWYYKRKTQHFQMGSSKYWMQCTTFLYKSEHLQVKYWSVKYSNAEKIFIEMRWVKKKWSSLPSQTPVQCIQLRPQLSYILAGMTCTGISMEKLENQQYQRKSCVWCQKNPTFCFWTVFIELDYILIVMPLFSFVWVCTWMFPNLQQASKG